MKTQVKRTKHKANGRTNDNPTEQTQKRATASIPTCAPTSRRSRQPTDLGQRVEQVATYHHGLQHVTEQDKVKKILPKGDTCKRAVPWVGARVAWINGSNAVRTPVSDPLERARVHAYAAGTGATVGPARVGLSALSNHWISPVFGKVWGYLKIDS